MDPHQSRASRGRHFSYLCAGICLFAGIQYALSDTNLTRGIALWSVGAIFLILSCFAPGVLTPISRIALPLLDLSGRLIVPIVSGIVFFGLLMPIGLVARLLGRDVLKLRASKSATYWYRVPTLPATANRFRDPF